MAKHVLGIIIGSTRPGRAGKPIADWFTSIAAKHASFETKVLDLKLSPFHLPTTDGYPARQPGSGFQQPNS
jgi:NAD(P)H-dependent FMN reductase